MGKPENLGVIGFRGFVAMFLTAMVLVVVLLTCLLLKTKYDRDISKLTCPDMRTDLVPFPDTQGPNIVLNNRTKYLISKSITSNATLRITDGAMLIVQDKALTLMFKYILIEEEGSLVIGSETCRYKSPLNIILTGTSNDQAVDPTFGSKFIGVEPTGSLEIHGMDKLSWTYLSKTINPGTNDTVLELAGSADGWMAGDKIVIASSDYNMEHAEVFTLMACPTCKPNQVKIKGPISYMHSGEMVEQLDSRAEVGLLTRNIKISGAMQACTSMCNVYSYDTFGGHIMVLAGARSFRMQGVELENMGKAGLTSAQSRSPITLHRLFDASDYFIKRLSIHRSYSGCVSIEATQNLLIEDIVGYDSLGHCFAMKEGTEWGNILSHNLGLVTRSGVFTPAERNDLNCVLLSTNYSGHVPEPNIECNGVSTFFITHPNNFLVNNSAGGSESTGFSYAFYREPILMSTGMLPPYQIERSPLGSFYNNRAHSNARVGLSLGRGIKSAPPSDSDPTDFQTLNDNAKFAPHLNSNLLGARVPAVISSFTAYRNGLGVFVRGGDVSIQGARLAANDVGVIMSSSDTLPYDAGSQQKLIDSWVIGHPTTSDATFLNRQDPAFGVQLDNGPLLVQNVHFMNFMSNPQRESYAIGFVPKNTGQLSVKNTIGFCTFTNVSSKIYFGRRNSSYWGDNDKDGDLFQIVQDLAGSITGTQASYIIRPDNPLLHTDSCTDDATQGISYCPAQSYGQLFINALTKTALLNIDALNFISIVSLSGADNGDPMKPNTTQYQATLEANRNYRLVWTNDKVPERIEVSMYNFHKSDYLILEFCYPPNSTFDVTGRQWSQQTGSLISTSELETAPNQAFVEQTSSQVYFWNATSRLLYLKLVNYGQTSGSYYCPDAGCETVIINANTHGQQFIDCY